MQKMRIQTMMQMRRNIKMMTWRTNIMKKTKMCEWNMCCPKQFKTNVWFDGCMQSLHVVQDLVISRSKTQRSHSIYMQESLHVDLYMVQPPFWQMHSCKC